LSTKKEDDNDDSRNSSSNSGSISGSKSNSRNLTSLAQIPAEEKSENNVLQNVSETRKERREKLREDRLNLNKVREDFENTYDRIIDKVPAGNRRRLDDERKSITHKFSIAEHEGYITAGMYPDNTLGEIFLSGIGKEGSTLKGVLEGWAIAVSMGLQYGVSLESFAQKFSHMSFEPNGLTSNPEIRNAHSILDYVMRWLISKFGDHDQHEKFGVMTSKVKEYKTQNLTADIPTDNGQLSVVIGKICSCGTIMNRTGTCYTCPSCGNNTGCG
jgi:ribonucleoside-diphosphate reductase alpha chain